MACEYIYKGTTYSSKEEFISKVIPTLQNSTLSKFDKVPTNKQVYLSSIKNYEDNIVNFEKAIQAIKDNNYKIILPNNAGRYVASVESEGIRGGTIPIAENPYNKEAKEGKFDKEYALSYLKGRIEIEKGSIENENRKIKEIEKVENDVYNKNISSNQFLQLLNKDNNWVTFFVKSIIQDSVKKGYEKVLFPSGDTAAKVEGHTTLEEFKKQKEDRLNYLNTAYVVQGKKGGSVYTSTYDNLQLAKDNFVEGREILKLSETEDGKLEINQLKQELERVETEGFGALKPIYNFYENTVTNILKKQGYNPVLITDEYGNTWNEVRITDKAYSTILLNLKHQGYYKSIPEYMLNKLSQSSILSRVNEDFGDRWYFVRGESAQNENIQKNIEKYNHFMSMNNLNTDMFIYNNTKNDKAPFLEINPKFNEQDSIQENNEKIKKDKYEAIISFFKDKLGIKDNQIVYTSKEEFKKQFPESYENNMQSAYSNGKFYFFTRNLTSDITVEELLHPFVSTVKELNPKLFNNLLKEAQRHYKKLNTKIQALYADKSKTIREQELVTQALSRVFNNVYENEEPKSFLETIKDFVKWLSKILQDIFNEYSTGKYINIPIDKLPVQTSMYELAKLLNASDTRFDVMFSDMTMYSKNEENTTSYNKIVKDILTDQKVEAKVIEIFSKLPKALKEIKNKLNNTINETDKKNLQSIIKNIEELENEDNQNLISFQLKGIVASVNLSNELIRNLTAMKNSDYDDNIKLSYYISVLKTAQAMSSFKDLMIELKRELTSNLVLANTKDISNFIGQLTTAISSEDELSSYIQQLVKTPLLNKLFEHSESSYLPTVDKLKSELLIIDNKIKDNNTPQSQKDKLFIEYKNKDKHLKELLKLAPTKENLELVINGLFKDANSMSHIFEAKIANGNPLVSTLQDMINQIYDNASKYLLEYKNIAQSKIDTYSKETGFSLRDMDKRYEQIRDITKIPTELTINDNGDYMFKYVEQDSLLSDLDTKYITEYLELELIKNYWLDKHLENYYNNKVDNSILDKFKEANSNFKKFIKENSTEEYTQEIYDFKSIMDEKIGEKTLREITGDIYNRLDEESKNLEGSESNTKSIILDTIKDLNTELKLLRNKYDENGNEKTGDALKIAELLTKYNKLRNEYYTSTITESSLKKYQFDLEALESKKKQYEDSGRLDVYNSLLSNIQKQTISSDYFEALKNISSEISNLNNILFNNIEQLLPKYAFKDIFKEKKKNIYEEIKQLSNPYRDEDGIIDGIKMLNKHPEIVTKIRDYQQYIENIKYETAKLGSLSISESNEYKLLVSKEIKTQEEINRLNDLTIKRTELSNFKKENKALLDELNSLYKMLGDLTITFETEYYQKAFDIELNKAKVDVNIINQARTFIKDNNITLINDVIYQKGGENLDENIWYIKQILGQKITYIPLNKDSDTGYNEMLDIVTSYLANESVKISDWYRDNHYTTYQYNDKTKIYEEKLVPLYIWKHQTPNNPNFIISEPASQYKKFEVKPEYINKNYKTTYRGIPLPKSNKYINEKYRKLDKNTEVFKFLDYYTKDYLNDQEIYNLKGDFVKMGYVLPAVIKTSGENSVNFTKDLVGDFKGTVSQIFQSNVGETDSDTSFLVGGGQSNNKAIPVRFVGKMDTKAQSKNIISSLLLFKYHASLYKELNNVLPVFEAAKLVADNVEVLENKNYVQKLSFSKKIKNLFTNKIDKVDETQSKITEKSVLSKSVNDILDIHIYGQRMKSQIIDLGPLGKADLAKVSSGILGFSAKAMFVGNIISALNNYFSTNIQVIINSAINKGLYTPNNLKNGITKAKYYTKDIVMDWSKLGNKSLIGQVLEYFAVANENPSADITSKAEFTLLKNKMELLASPKQASEFEVLVIQFLTIADATPIKIGNKISKLSNIEDIFELKNNKIQIKDGVELTEKQEKFVKGKYQSVARKVAGAYRQTEISSIETNPIGKAGMFLRRYFTGMATNRFQGTRFSYQEGDIYTGYQREVFKNMFNLFKIYKGNFIKYYNELSDQEKAAHIKMMLEYGSLMIIMGLFSILGGDDPKKELKENSWLYNMQLVGLLRAKAELQQFTIVGIDDLIRIGKNPFMAFNTLGNITKTFWLIAPTILGDEDAFYKQNSGLHKKGDSKLLANFLKVFGYTGATFAPEEYIVNFRNAQNR